jgi:MoaA/NifB/PqqE/SkfB family radical SAM enzyme
MTYTCNLDCCHCSNSYLFHCSPTHAIWCDPDETESISVETAKEIKIKEEKPKAKMVMRNGKPRPKDLKF